LDNNQALIPFKFQEHDIRVVMRDGAPWWVASDACKALALNTSNIKQFLDRLDADEKDRYGIPTPGGVQSTWIVNEPGLYTLILRSDKPEAKEFKRWITHDVIPSIRTTGAYSVNQPPLQGGVEDYVRNVLPVPGREHIQALRHLVRTAEQYTQAVNRLLDPNTSDTVVGSGAQLPAPKSEVDKNAPDYVQAQIVKHLRKHGPLTFNTLRHSYMKRYDAMTVRANLVALIQQGKVYEFDTSQATKYTLVALAKGA
jgi:prophage antirepressor-like protein